MKYLIDKMVYVSRMGNDLKFAKCQQCGKTAKGEPEIKVLFGYRTFQENTHVHSWCVECRSHSRL